MNKQRKKLNVKDYEKHIGDTYGYLVIKEFYACRPESETRYDNLKNTIWCRCECNGNDGKNHEDSVSCYYPWYMLRSGYIGSCGCMILENFRETVKRRTRKLTKDGETLTVEEWSEKLGISISCIRHRMRAGKPIAEILDPKTNARGTKLEEEVTL